MRSPKKKGVTPGGAKPCEWCDVPPKTRKTKGCYGEVAFFLDDKSGTSKKLATFRFYIFTATSEPRKRPSDFPLNPGWLIGFLIMVYYNPYITG